MSICLLPEPKDLEEREGSFSIQASTLIAFPAQAGDDAFTIASQLQDEVWQATRLTLPIVKVYAPPRVDNIILLVCGTEQADAFGVERADRQLPDTVSAQAYTLTITQNNCVAYADSPTGLFYAAQTLRQLVRLQASELQALTIHDWPTLPYRGTMLDISRGKVPTLTTLKQLVEELSHYKLNVLQLYTEHTFQFISHPQIGARCGSLSSADVLELDAFCRAHQVELMPNLQSFGHARNTLLIPAYQHLAESDFLWTLSPAFEDTYSLLDALFADMLPSFTSSTINIGCDETYDLGQGASRTLVEEIGLGRVYLNHILRVRELAARHGRRIQMWGDILLHHPELISEVPDDVTLLDWHYDPAETYPSVQQFAGAGRQFWVCPGVGSWNSIFPRLHGANANIRNFVRDGVAAGAVGMLNTDWGDCGHYQAMGLSWYGYVFGATQGWTGGVTTDETFNAAFGRLFFDLDHEVLMEALDQLARTNDLPNVHRRNRSHTALALFDEPLAGSTVEGTDALSPETLREMRSLAESAAVPCEALASVHPRELTLREMASAAHLTAYASRKTALAQAVRASLREIAARPDPIHDSALRLHDHILALRALDRELEALRAEFEMLWMARARPSEIQISLGYFANLRARFRNAIDWLDVQRRALLDGKRVDAELATYDTRGYRTLWQTWDDLF